jgi:hypothetical protein
MLVFGVRADLISDAFAHYVLCPIYVNREFHHAESVAKRFPCWRLGQPD